MITAEHAAITQTMDDDFTHAFCASLFLPVPAPVRQLGPEVKVYRDAAGNAVGHVAVAA